MPYSSEQQVLQDSMHLEVQRQAAEKFIATQKLWNTAKCWSCEKPKADPALAIPVRLKKSAEFRQITNKTSEAAVAAIEVKIPACADCTENEKQISKQTTRTTCLPMSGFLVALLVTMLLVFLASRFTWMSQTAAVIIGGAFWLGAIGYFIYGFVKGVKRSIALFKNSGRVRRFVAYPVIEELKKLGWGV